VLIIKQKLENIKLLNRYVYHMPITFSFGATQGNKSWGRTTMGILSMMEAVGL
jgi:hypothetical protein